MAGRHGSQSNLLIPYMVLVEKEGDKMSIWHRHVDQMLAQHPDCAMPTEYRDSSKSGHSILKHDVTLQ